MIDGMFQAGTDAALADMVQRPRQLPTVEPGVLKGFGLAVPRALAGAGLEVGAFGAEVAGAFGQVLGAYPEAVGYAPTGEAKKQADAARNKLLADGMGMSNPTGDALRSRARDIMPNPETTGAAGQLVGGLAGFMGKAVGYGLTLGPLGPLALAGDVGLTESDRLKQQGVGLGARSAAGAVAGAVAGASVVIPMSGATALARGIKGVAIGEGSMVGQSLAEKAILKAAGYDKIADTFDPFDPVALGVGLVPGALGAKFGRPAVKPGAVGVKPLAEMGLGERQALRYDDTRLDAYAVQAAQREGIPPEVLLAVKNAGEKSGPAATSPAGAQGVMQFMPATFKEFGRGDAMDPVNSIDAGAKYLKKLHDSYGDWDAAVAHYNGGGAQAAIVRGGGKPTIPETAKYLERVKAYLGDTLDQHAAAAVKANPDLVPAARVQQAAAALDRSRLTSDADLAGRDAHVQAVETAMDQMGRGERVAVDDVVGPHIIGAAEREANFKAWFGDSKVVDKQNGPLALYHATDADGIEAFDRSFLGRTTKWNSDAKEAINMARLGFWFADRDISAKSAASGVVYPVHVAIANPKQYKNFDSMWADAARYKDAESWRAALERKGNDGIVLKNDTEFNSTSFVAFNPEQVKSAIGNSGRYDPSSGSLTDPIQKLAQAIDELRAARTAAPESAPATAPEPSRAAPTIEAAKQAVADVGGRDFAAAMAEANHPPEVHNLAIGLHEAVADQAKAAGLLADFEHAARADTAAPLQDLAADAVDRARQPETAPAQAAIDRAAAEVSRLSPDLLVQLDGMDAPVRVGDLLEQARTDAASEVRDSKLIEVATLCALRH